MAGCDRVPRDSTGALDRILTARELRVGVANNAPWATSTGDAARGIEVEMLRRWGRTLGVRVLFEQGSEAELIERLHARDLDVVAAGFVRESPYGSRVAFTRPYIVSPLDVWAPPGGTPSPAARVLAVTPGESRLLFELDRFLIAHRADWQRLVGAP